MNKKMRELRTTIEEKINLAKSLTKDGASKDVAKAAAILDEVDKLEKEYAVEEKLFNLEKEETVPKALTAIDEKKQNEQQAEEKKAFFNNFRSVAKGIMVEGVDEDGGLTVPKDISTEIRHYRDSERSLLDLVNVEHVSTDKGSRTYQKKGDVEGFVEVDETGEIPEIDNPKFERVKYAIKDYAGILPFSNQLSNDSDANIEKEIKVWFGRNSRATANRLILKALNTKESIDLKGLPGIKRALNVTLGQAYKPTSVIVTNDDGIDYLDNLVDANGRPLLNPDPTAPAKKQLRVGANIIPIEPYPNKTLKSNGNKVPFFIGDFKEAVTYWDRQKMSIFASKTASAGNVNAFTQNLTLMRGNEREDVTLVDTDSFVNGYIIVPEEQPIVPPEETKTPEGE